jgi:FKBP-type peptidyl-prolyl cis-trans isomerase FkpA
MLKKNSLFIILSIILCLVFACDKTPQADLDQELIESYVAENNLNGQFTSSGLYYVITNEGTGDYPSTSDTVTVHYRGTLLDGKQFDSSYDNLGDPISLLLANTILGWQEGIPLFKAGGEGLLVIPSHLGYGENDVGEIPCNSVLVFDISLLSF